MLEIVANQRTFSPDRPDRFAIIFKNGIFMNIRDIIIAHAQQSFMSSSLDNWPGRVLLYLELGFTRPERLLITVVSGLCVLTGSSWKLPLPENMPEYYRRLKE